MPIRPPSPSRRWLPWLAALTLVSSAHAQRAASPTDADTVLATLKELKVKQAQIISKEKQNVMSTINAALADPVKAYEQAYVAVEFQGQGNDSLKIIDWRKKQGDLMRNAAFAYGLRLELAYISLTWQRSMGATNKDLLRALYDYVSQVAAAPDAMWSLEAFKKPPTLGNLVFVKYFQIGPYISAVEDWSDQPFDTDSIYQKSILPPLRELKDPRVLDYWTGRMQAEVARIDRGNNNLAVNKFNHVRRPELLWSRAEDELVIGQRDAGLADMLAIVKANPDHPSFDKWAQQLTDLVTPAKGTVTLRDVPNAPAPAPR